MSRSRKKAEHAVPATTLSAGHLLATTFATTARTTPSLLLLVLATQGPWALLEAAGVFEGVSEADYIRWGGLYGLVAGVLHSGAIVWLVHGVLQGERRRVVDCLRRAWRRYFSLLGASLQAAILTLLYLLLLVVPGVLRALSYAVVLPVVMLEDKNASASLARSTQLMDGHRGAVFLTMCVVLPLAIGPGALGFVLPSLQESAFARAGSSLLEAVLALPLEVLGVVLYVETVRAHSAFRREVFASADSAP